MVFSCSSIVILVLFLSSAFSDESPSALTSSPKLVCYFTTESYNKGTFTPEAIDPMLCTHINYDFAVLNEDKNRIDFGNKALDVDEKLYSRVIALKDKNPYLKVLLCLGGWNDSTKKYSDMVADPDQRSQFVSTVVPFLLEHGFDGLDVAWEYPNCWQGNCGINPDDVENFVTFLSDLRSILEPKGLLLSASVSAVREEVDEAYDVPSVTKLLDHINLMSYDWHGGWEKTTGNHAQFFRHPADLKPSMNLNSSVNHWIYRGVDKSKLIVGIPSYGRSFTLVDPKKNGLNSPALGLGKPGSETKERGLLAFHEICEDLDSWSHFEDNNVGTYAVKSDQWVGFDSPNVAVAKARFVLRQGLGGAAYKNFYTDDYKGSCFGYPFPILKSIRYGLTSEEEKEFETTEKSIRAFAETIQLSVLVQEERREVDSKEKDTGASEDDIYLKLTETEITDSGETKVKSQEVNVGTLDATGDIDEKTLAKIHVSFHK